MAFFYRPRKLPYGVYAGYRPMRQGRFVAGNVSMGIGRHRRRPKVIRFKRGFGFLPRPNYRS